MIHLSARQALNSTISFVSSVRPAPPILPEPMTSHSATAQHPFMTIQMSWDLITRFLAFQLQYPYRYQGQLYSCDSDRAYLRHRRNQKCRSHHNFLFQLLPRLHQYPMHPLWSFHDLQHYIIFLSMQHLGTVLCGWRMLHQYKRQLDPYQPCK